MHRLKKEELQEFVETEVMTYATDCNQRRIGFKGRVRSDLLITLTGLYRVTVCEEIKTAEGHFSQWAEPTVLYEGSDRDQALAIYNQNY